MGRPPFVTWDDLATFVREATTDIGDGFLVVSAPRSDGSAAPAAPRRRFGRRRSTDEPTVYVQFTAAEDRLRAEAIGATSFGGDDEQDEATQTALRALGWRRPDEVDDAEFPNWVQWLPPGADPGALVVASLQRLGVTDPTAVTIDGDRPTGPPILP